MNKSKIFLAAMLLLFVFNTFAQNITPPTASIASGFYESNFTVSITHPNPQAVIIYTLDGSTPHLDNVGGFSYNYKNYYPGNPGESFGELLQNTIETLVYSDEVLIFDKSHLPNKIANIATSYRHNTYIPNTPVYKGTVLRFRAVIGTEYSETVTKNYFVSPMGAERYSLPVILINVDEDKLYSYEYGLNVPGRLFDKWREDNPFDFSDEWTPANYQNSGSSSELKINFGYMEKGIELLNHGVGLRNHGNGSRWSPNRSFRLYAKSEYGASNFNHPFFKDYSYHRFKRIILRNSGNDAFKTAFRDAFAQQLVKHLNLEIQEYNPAIVFINSEYHGILNIRERYDDKFFERKYDIAAAELDFLENDGIIGEGDDIHFHAMMYYLRNHSLADDNNYEYVKTLLDPINFTDYYISNIYSGNTDWPHNNSEFWRKKVPYTPHAPYGHDGRWRWVLKDLDFSFNYHDDHAEEFDALQWATRQLQPLELNADFYNNSTLIARRLLENDQYKNYFINRFADLLNTTFQPDRVEKIITEIESIFEPEIDEHIARWSNLIYSHSIWTNNVQVMKDFAFLRDNFQRKHIKEKFNLEGNYDIVLDISDEEHGFVRINTIDIKSETPGIGNNPYIWIGSYFKDIPVKLTAIPKEGYVFSHWSGEYSDTVRQLTINPSSDIYVKANFISQEEANELGIQENITLNEVTVYPNPFTDELYVLSHTYDMEFILYSTDGKLIESGKLTGSKLNLGHVPSGPYFLKLISKGESVTKQVFKK